MKTISTPQDWAQTAVTPELAHDERDPVVVLAADENFAMPLAATVRSALDNLAADRKLRIIVLDGGIQEATKRRLSLSWPAGRYSLQWICPDAEPLADVPVSGHISVVSYYRILIPRVLPASLQRAIYLDADLLVRVDLGRLWDQSLAGQLCLAAQDCAAPYLNAAIALPNYARCQRFLSATEPVANYRRLGLKPDAPYFNAGVMLIDLAGWRQCDLSTRMLACLAEHREHVLWWDQYALNVELAGRWGLLDVRWNQGAHAFRYPSWQDSPFDRPTFDQLRDDPYVVHFTSRTKPWQPLCRHPYRGEYFRYAGRTAWSDWRPPRLEVAREVAKALERNVRAARNWLRDQARQWWRSGTNQPT